jgi:hypothetical protein
LQIQIAFFKMQTEYMDSVVTPPPAGRRLRLTRALVVTLIGVGIVVICAVCVIAVLPVHRQGTKPDVAQASADKLLTQVSQGDQSVAVPKLEQAAKSAGSDHERAVYELALAHSYFELAQPAKALPHALAAERAEPTDQSAALLATAYRDEGDLANAARYFGLAAARSPKPRDPSERSPRSDYLNEQRDAERHLK